MPTDHTPAVLFLRMSPQLRQALPPAADRAGVSLNAYAVQMLAAAAGDPAGFRASVDVEEQLGAAEMFKLAKQYDAEDPGYYVEWERSRNAVS